jgi:hypothetical protein
VPVFSLKVDRQLVAGQQVGAVEAGILGKLSRSGRAASLNCLTRFERIAELPDADWPVV